MIRNEPVLTAGTIGSIVVAFLFLLTEFGLPLTDGQQAAITGLVAVVAPLIVAYFGRRGAFGPVTVERERRERHGH